MLVCVLGKCGVLLFDMVDGMLWVGGINVFGVLINVNLVWVVNVSFGSMM